ncbi:STAS domain-containing protein [Streptomyces sp. NPDC093088]|uniref:STAS domain-containing protein n=1 Tax=Streptomyces sp. NPDC093088 TaxID=3366023 RepID=UPI0038235EE0
MADSNVTKTEKTDPSGRLSAVVTATDGIHVVSLSGEIDHSTGDTLRQALAFPDTPRPRVIADMRQVAFMDSSGINILITAHRTLTEAGGWLRLAGTTTAVMRTISIVGLDTVIDCHDTLTQALNT